MGRAALAQEMQSFTGQDGAERKSILGSERQVESELSLPAGSSPENASVFGGVPANVHPEDPPGYSLLSASF